MDYVKWNVRYVAVGTWAEEQTDTKLEFREAVLGHRIDCKVAQTYKRSDLLEKRQRLKGTSNNRVFDIVAAAGAA
jgi:hypothetical protein